MMTEVGGKLKAGLFAASVALFGVLAFSARTADLVKIKGEACEKFVPGQSKSSIRVRVTDKASYKAVSQVESLSELRSSMLEHDFNVIVYNLVDNYVQDLMVRTVSQNDNKLCVKVTGAIPAADIVTVIANYSPHNPAPEYDIKEAAGIEEEVLTEADDPVAAESREPDSEVLYDGREELAAEQETEVGSETGNEEPAVVYGGEAEDEANDYLTAGELPPPPENGGTDGVRSGESCRPGCRSGSDSGGVRKGLCLCQPGRVQQQHAFVKIGSGAERHVCRYRRLFAGRQSGKRGLCAAAQGAESQD